MKNYFSEIKLLVILSVLAQLHSTQTDTTTTSYLPYWMENMKRDIKIIKTCHGVKFWICEHRGKILFVFVIVLTKFLLNVGLMVYLRKIWLSSLKFSELYLIGTVYFVESLWKPLDSQYRSWFCLSRFQHTVFGYRSGESIYE